MSMRSARRFLGENSGVGASEFVLIAPFLIGVMFVIAELGVIFYYSSRVDTATYALVRAIEQGASVTDLTAATKVVTASLGSIDKSNLAVVVDVLPTSSAPSTAIPTASSFTTPTSLTPMIVTVAVDRPLPILATIFGVQMPDLFGTRISTTLVATKL